MLKKVYRINYDNDQGIKQNKYRNQNQDFVGSLRVHRESEGLSKMLSELTKKIIIKSRSLSGVR